jgi:hypothetical protein
MIQHCLSCSRSAQCRLIRGCCRACYNRLNLLVRGGKCTWAALDARGVTRPSRYLSAEQRAQGVRRD